MTIKLGKVVCYYKGLLRIKSHNPLNTWSDEMRYISTSTRLLAIKRGKMGTYYEDFSPIKPRNLLKTGFFLGFFDVA